MAFLCVSLFSRAACLLPLPLMTGTRVVQMNVGVGGDVQVLRALVFCGPTLTAATAAELDALVLVVGWVTS